jgi:hypothetical protein
MGTHHELGDSRAHVLDFKVNTGEQHLGSFGFHHRAVVPATCMVTGFLSLGKSRGDYGGFRNTSE